MVKLTPGSELQTHRGVLKHDDLIGLPWGSQVQSHNGAIFHLLEPALSDILRDTPRRTQVMYPKDIGFILVTTGVGPGKTVIEAGTGSGSMTTALAYAVGDEGHVYSYEKRSEFSKLAESNLTRLGLEHRVTFKQRDIEAGLDESGADVFFLDVQRPFDYVDIVRETLKSGGFFASICPTTNQVTRLVRKLKDKDFAFIEVCEIMLRFYKPSEDRFRPVDRMIAHTGFLVFACRILKIDSGLEEGA